MPTDMLTTNERAAAEPVEASPAAAEDELRAWARKHVERVRRLKRNVAAYGLGMLFATAIWAIVEWQDHGGFERFSGEGNPDDWERWVL